MGLIVGAVAGFGLVLVSAALVDPRPRRLRAVRLPDPTPVLAACAGALAGLLLTGVPVVGVVAGAATAILPAQVRASRRRRHAAEIREAWPDAIGQLVGAVRAGFALGDAVAGLGDRGPAPLRPAFTEVGRRYRLTGDLALALGALDEHDLGPVAATVGEVLVLARDLGGHDVGAVLRGLVRSLREDLRIRRELEARQAWTATAARVAAVAPWAALLMLSARPQAREAYQSFAGGVVVLGGACATWAGYAWMRRAGRLPEVAA